MTTEPKAVGAEGRGVRDWRLIAGAILTALVGAGIALDLPIDGIGGDTVAIEIVSGSTIEAVAIDGSVGEADLPDGGAVYVRSSAGSVLVVIRNRESESQKQVEPAARAPVRGL